MPLVWRAKARRDVDAIVDYIAARNPTAARKMEAMIARAVDLLGAHPLLHRPGRLSGTREAVIHPNYIIVYRVRDDVVTILSVIHTRQNYP